jgi:hypothetical protein
MAGTMAVQRGSGTKAAFNDKFANRVSCKLQGGKGPQLPLIAITSAL